MSLTPGSKRSTSMTWTNNYTGDKVASAEIVFSTWDEQWGSCEIRFGDRIQHLTLEGRPRHWGVSVVLSVSAHTPSCVGSLDAGSRSFACRQTWARQVAYGSQFLDRNNRAHRGKAKINARLYAIGGFNPDEWDLPPKPKWMRWATYNRAEERFDRYEQILDDGLAMAALRFMAERLAR
jgi:hypothetical protein